MLAGEFTNRIERGHSKTVGQKDPHCYNKSTLWRYLFCGGHRWWHNL